MAEAAAVIDNKQTAIFELQVKNLRDHVDVHEKMNETKFDKIEALMARNLAKQEELIGEIRSEVREMGARMSRMERRLDGLQEDMSEVKGEIKAIKASFKTLQNKFAWNLAWMGIIMALAIALAQYFGK